MIHGGGKFMQFLIIFGGFFGALFLLLIGASILTNMRIARAFSRIRKRERSHHGSARTTVQRHEYGSIPAPVKTYFQAIFPESQSMMRFAHIRHSGQFRQRPDDDWYPVRGIAHYSADEPGFVWKGHFGNKTAHLTYLNGHGSSFLKLFNSIPLLESSGKETSVSLLVRYLMEAVWYPTALLPTNGVQWQPIDNSSARMTLRDNGLSVSVTVYFDENGLINRMETFDKFRDFKNHFEKARFIMLCKDYKKFDSVPVPSTLQFIWALPEGDFHYGEFIINSIVYEY